jgi:hypothetical protein
MVGSKPNLNLRQACRSCQVVPGRVLSWGCPVKFSYGSQSDSQESPIWLGWARAQLLDAMPGTS